MKLPQPLRDWLHERHIKHLGDQCAEAMRAHDRAKAQHFWDAMAKAIGDRSSAQIARMEARIDVRFRRSIKRNVMHAFLRGKLPAGFVTAVFRVFKLRGL